MPLTNNLVYEIRPDQRLLTSPGGGGGVGDPFERDVEAVCADVRNGLVSPEAARVEYGVVLDPDTFEVDEAATAPLRMRVT